MKNRPTIREKPRSWLGLIKDGIRNHTKIIFGLAAFFCISQLVLDFLIFTHLYVYKLSIYQPASFAGVKLWHILADLIFWIYIIYLLWNQLLDSPDSQ